MGIVCGDPLYPLFLFPQTRNLRVRYVTSRVGTPVGKTGLPPPPLPLTLEPVSFAPTPLKQVRTLRERGD